MRMFAVYLYVLCFCVNGDGGEQKDEKRKKKFTMEGREKQCSLFSLFSSLAALVRLVCSALICSTIYDTNPTHPCSPCSPLNPICIQNIPGARCLFGMNTLCGMYCWQRTQGEAKWDERVSKWDTLSWLQPCFQPLTLLVSFAQYFIFSGCYLAVADTDNGEASR